MDPRAFVTLVIGFGAILLASIGALNLAMDPYGAAEGEWYRLRSSGWTAQSDRTPDHGLAARATMARRGGVTLLLLGTSRTVYGFTSRPDRLNAGITNGALDEYLRILRAAAQAPRPPRFALMETPAVLSVAPDRRHFMVPDWPRPAERLFSWAAIETSVALWREALTPRLPDPQDREAQLRGRSYAARAFVKDGEGAGPDYLPRALAELMRLCRMSGMRTIVYEPPLYPDLLHDTAIAAAVRTRETVYRRAAAGLSQEPCRPLLVDHSGFSAPLPPLARDRRNWYDEHHFNQGVGDELIPTLIAEAQATTR